MATAKAANANISAKLRAICLALPEASETATRHGPSYRVAGKFFALERAHGVDRALWCKVPSGVQQSLVGADCDQRFFIPRYFGVKGWIGVALDGAVNWAEVEALVRRSHVLVARGRLPPTATIRTSDRGAPRN